MRDRRISIKIEAEEVLTDIKETSETTRSPGKPEISESPDNINRTKIDLVYQPNQKRERNTPLNHPWSKLRFSLMIQFDIKMIWRETPKETSHLLMLLVRLN